MSEQRKGKLLCGRDGDYCGACYHGVEHAPKLPADVMYLCKFYGECCKEYYEEFEEGKVGKKSSR